MSGFNWNVKADDIKRVVVIGGVAAGMSAASQAKRRRKDLEVVVLEATGDVSYGSCGIPYNVEDIEKDPESLVVLTAQQFREKRGLDVRLMHRAMRIDPEAREVYVHDLVNDREVVLGYDTLVYGTGASAVMPPWPGRDGKGVFTVRTLHDARLMKHYIKVNSPHRAVIVGGGYIGMEFSETFRTLGMDVTVIEKMPHIVPGLEPEIREKIEEELARNEVTVKTGESVTEIVLDSQSVVKAVRTDRGQYPADLVLVAVGVKPNASLAAQAGAELGARGAVLVDEYLRTSVPRMFAAGDCATHYHRITGRQEFVPLGTTSNKQGRISGANAAGFQERFTGIVGTSVFKVFGLEVAMTGLGRAAMNELGFSYAAAHIDGRTRAHSYHGAKPIRIWMAGDTSDARLIGAQMVGGEGVSKRIDILAAALYGSYTVHDVANLDLAYAPPFSPVWDPVLVAANVLRKKLPYRLSV